MKPICHLCCQNRLGDKHVRCRPHLSTSRLCHRLDWGQFFLFFFFFFFFLPCSLLVFCFWELKSDRWLLKNRLGEMVLVKEEQLCVSTCPRGVFSQGQFLCVYGLDIIGNWSPFFFFKNFVVRRWCLPLIALAHHTHGPCSKTSTRHAHTSQSWHIRDTYCTALAEQITW